MIWMKHFLHKKWANLQTQAKALLHIQMFIFSLNNIVTYINEFKVKHRKMYFSEEIKQFKAITIILKCRRNYYIFKVKLKCIFKKTAAIALICWYHFKNTRLVTPNKRVGWNNIIIHESEVLIKNW